MARLYRVWFRTVEKDFNPERRYAKKKNKHGPDDKLILNVDNSITLLEADLLRHWEYGDGVDRLEYAGELNDNLFKPTLSEPDFVDDQIKSKKNGEIIGFQG